MHAKAGIICKNIEIFVRGLRSAFKLLMVTLLAIFFFFLGGNHFQKLRTLCNFSGLNFDCITDIIIKAGVNMNLSEILEVYKKERRKKIVFETPPDS